VECWPNLTDEVLMAIIQIDLNDEALADAMRLSGTKSVSETVNAALRAYVCRLRRIEALEEHAANAQSWDRKGWQEMRMEDKRLAR
jgi:Arc/MetJ family transcription regulator